MYYCYKLLMVVMFLCAARSQGIFLLNEYIILQPDKTLLFGFRTLNYKNTNTVTCTSKSS